MSLSRRGFLKQTVTVSAGSVAARYVKIGTALAAGAAPQMMRAAAKPAALGGTPVRQAAFPVWPIYDQQEETALRGVLKSGQWFRGSGRKVGEFEEAYAKLIGAPHCVATANGTGALFTALTALDVGPGDEVVLSPYTFIATLNVVVLNYALPIFADSDLESFEIDARKIEPAITERTAAILPVHLGGNPADLDTIMDVSRRRGIPVVEDACQAWLAEWRGKKVGTYGIAGCFSFQASKNLNAGEGGAVVTSDANLAEGVYAAHNNNRGRKVTGYNFKYRGSRAANLRMTEWQGAMLLSQMTRLESQARTREQNAEYLSAELRKIPGVVPARMYAGTTRNAYHLYMFRFVPEQFGGGLTRAQFIKALTAEGIPCSSGYTPLNREPLLQEVLASKAYRRIYPTKLLADWAARNQCPVNEQLCNQAVWLTQPMLLGPRRDMDDIVAAIAKIRAHAPALANQA